MSANRNKSAYILAEVVLQLIDYGAFTEVLNALDSEILTKECGSASIAKLSAGRVTMQRTLSKLVTLWISEFSSLDNSAFAMQMVAIKEAVILTESEITQTEVVWTGPKIEGFYLRATRQVVQDIISAAQSELLVVGYWLAGKEDYEGIINDIIELMVYAIARGVKVTMVLDEGERAMAKTTAIP